ncbi:hypothetical protein ILYODFUR_014311 [Ilyodon furcidens]|uniref:Uncharacterized protein n=1 Tax=Ilyodon furcidens TaxID=33524 RepID=A0ABV0UFZ4_9TELE
MEGLVEFSVYCGFAYEETAEYVGSTQVLGPTAMDTTLNSGTDFSGTFKIKCINLLPAQPGNGITADFL